MKKYLIISALAIILSASVFAGSAEASTYSQVINLKTGWNIISTPRVVQSHSFSATEISSNFDIFVLDAASVAGWSTMSEVGQSEFTPLYGYFINNKTSSTQQLTLNYKDGITPAERLFERQFTHTGWYSIGVANPTYSKVQSADKTNTGNAANILDSTKSNHSTFIDFTDSNFSSDPASVSVSDSWKAATPNDLVSINDLRETKGYAIYITNISALYSGFQNTDVVPGIDSIFPASVIVGGSDFTLTINGYSFVASSTVNWNGSPLVTTLVSPNQLTAIVPAVNIISATSSNITVQNPNPGGGTSNSKTLQSSQLLTVSLATNSPTGNVARGQSGITVAKFSIFAAGEAVKVKFLDFNIVVATSGAGYVATDTAGQELLSTQIKNVSLVDDQGSQVGSTINTPPSTNTCTGTGALAAVTAGGIYTDCFGTSASPINYIIPANTTRVLSLKVDIQNTADFSSIKGSLSGDTGNLQGLISASVADTGQVSGSVLNLAASSLTVAANSAVGNQTVTKNATSARIGSYTFTASTAEGVSISNVTIKSGATGASNFNNLLVKVGSTQFGSVYPTVNSGTPYTFLGTPFTVPAGQSVVVDVYAGVLSGASVNEQATTLSGCTGTGLVSFSSISCVTSPNGQVVNIGGGAKLTVSVDSGATASVGQLIMGTNQNSLATFRLTETSGNEDVKVTDLNVFQSVGTTTSNAAINPALEPFANLVLYNGSTVLGTAGSANTSAGTTLNSSSTGNTPGFYWKFHFNSAVVVPKSSSVSLTLKGDVNPFNTNVPVDAATSTFRIATSTDSDNNSTSTTVVALGNSSNQVATVSLSGAVGNTQTVLRSNLLVTAASLGTISGRSKNITDDVGTITFTAANGGGVVLNAVTTTISGTLASSTFLSAGDVKLWDPSQNVAVGTAVTSSLCAGTGSSCVITFQIGTSTAGYTISGGNSKTFNIRINSLTNTKAPVSGVSLSLAVSINANTDISFTDAVDGTGIVANLPATAAPINISSVSYAAGS